MLSLVYTSLVYGLLFWLVFLIWLSREIFRHKQQSKPEEVVQQEDRGTMVTLLISLFTGLGFSFLFSVLLPAAAITWNRPLVFFTGIVLMVLGIILRQYSVWMLGRYFTLVVSTYADHQVVQNGPYRLIRHPSYTGTLMTLLGIGLALTNWASIVAVLAGFFVGHLRRIKVEEQVLSTTLGQPYVEYMRHTKMLIPFVF